jgi:DNA-binding PadR family transcriptional regulator
MTRIARGQKTSSTLGMALLSLLAREPLSGYDLAQRLDDNVGFFWHAQHSQIYPELQRLATRGLISGKTVKQSDRPHKKIYSLTERGKKTLAEWVTSPFDAPPLRDELTLRAWSLWVADSSRAAALFRAEETRHRKRLAEYRAFEKQIEAGWQAQLDDPSTPEFATWATLLRGLGYEKEYAEWCRRLADLLERRPRS